MKTDYSVRKCNPYRLNTLIEHSGDSILDVGCGSGAYVHKLRDQKNIQGVDYQEFDSWKEAPELFKVSLANKLPFEDNSFDTVSCFEVLEHLEDPTGALRELKRVASKNVILSVPDCTWPDFLKKGNLLFSHYSDRTHVNFFTPKTLRELFEQEGFKVVEQKAINPVNPMPLIENYFKFSNNLLDRILKKRLKRLEKNEIFITTMIVAEVSKS